MCKLEWMLNRELHVALKTKVSSIIEDDSSDNKDILTGGFKAIYGHTMRTAEIRGKFEANISTMIKDLAPTLRDFNIEDQNDMVDLEITEVIETLMTGYMKGVEGIDKDTHLWDDKICQMSDGKPSKKDKRSRPVALRLELLLSLSPKRYWNMHS